MKKKIGVVHALFRCDDCGAEFDNFKNAQALAAKHAKQKRHKVVGEVGIAVTYDDRTA